MCVVVVVVVARLLVRSFVRSLFVSVPRLCRWRCLLSGRPKARGSVDRETLTAVCSVQPPNPTARIQSNATVVVAALGWCCSCCCLASQPASERRLD